MKVEHLYCDGCGLEKHQDPDARPTVHHLLAYTTVPLDLCDTCLEWVRGLVARRRKEFPR
jgi:hypothetical protein